MAMEEAEKTRVLSAEGAAAVSAPVGAMEATQMGGTTACPVCGTVNPALETYCSECGFLLSSQPGAPAEAEAEEQAACPYSLVDERTGRRYALHSGDNLVGREAGDVLLVDGTVSRKHAVITVTEDGVTVTDQGSTNGTRVDGVGLKAGTPQPVRAGATLQFGAVALRLDGPEGSAPAEATQAMSIETGVPTEEHKAVETSRGPAVATLHSDGVHAEDIVVYDGTMTIGRRPDNDHVISGDPFVSGRHARIEASAGWVEITDLGSTNGTFVNGRRLEPNEPAILVDGDEVVLGKGKYTVTLMAPEAEEETGAEDTSNETAEKNDSDWA